MALIFFALKRQTRALLWVKAPTLISWFVKNILVLTLQYQLWHSRALKTPSWNNAALKTVTSLSIVRKYACTHSCRYSWHIVVYPMLLQVYRFTPVVRSSCFFFDLQHESHLQLPPNCTLLEQFQIINFGQHWTKSAVQWDRRKTIYWPWKQDVWLNIGIEFTWWPPGAGEIDYQSSSKPTITFSRQRTTLTRLSPTRSSCSEAPDVEGRLAAIPLAHVGRSTAPTKKF